MKDSASKDLITSNMYGRGLTPRNVSPQKRSISIQVQCQQQNNVEKAIHHFVDNKLNTSSDEIDMNVIEYTDDKVETYSDIVDGNLRDLQLRGGSKRFIDINVVTDSINQLVCGQCAREGIDEAENNVLQSLKQFVETNKFFKTMVQQIDEFDRIRLRNKKRKVSKMIPLSFIF